MPTRARQETQLGKGGPETEKQADVCSVPWHGGCSVPAEGPCRPTGSMLPESKFSREARNSKLHIKSPAI